MRFEQDERNNALEGDRQQPKQKHKEKKKTCSWVVMPGPSAPPTPNVQGIKSSTSQATGESRMKIASKQCNARHHKRCFQKEKKKQKQSDLRKLNRWQRKVEQEKRNMSSRCKRPRASNAHFALCDVVKMGSKSDSGQSSIMATSH